MSGVSCEVTLQVHEGLRGCYVKATIWGTVAGRYGSQGVVLIPIPRDHPPLDHEEMVVLALRGLNHAVYDS